MAEDVRLARGPQDKHAVHARIVQRLQANAEEITRLLAGLSDQDLARRTVPEKWSVKEVLCHLDSIHEVFDARVQAMLGEDNPVLPAFEPDGDPGFAARVQRPAESVLSDFLARREALVMRLEELRPADWHRPGRHPEYASYDVHFCVEYLGLHEAHHLYQMYQRRAALGPIPH
jgi:DinB family protein